MQINKSCPKPLKGLIGFFFFTSLFFSLTVNSQSTYLPFGDKQYILLDRLEIKAQKDSTLNFSKIKPFNRKYVIAGVNRFTNDNSLSKVDAYNLRSLYLNNIEYLTPEQRLQYASKKPIWNKLNSQ